MKKVFGFMAACVAVLGLIACNPGNENNTEATPAATDSVEAQQATADPAQRDYESADLSLTIPEGWAAEVTGMDGIEMKGKGENGFDPKITADVMKGRKVADVVANEATAGVVKNEGVKIGEYTFTVLDNEGAGMNKCFAQVGDDVLRVVAVFIKPDAPEAKAVIESIKLK